MRILIAEDDRSIRDAVRRALILAGYEAEGVEDGQAALDRITESAPDALVLDIGMPKVDGLEVCRRVRQAGDRTPILMLTARDAVSDRIEGLDAGADDYLIKPFDVGELQARLRALLRRAESGSPEAAAVHDKPIVFAELRLDRARHGVVVDDAAFIELTRTEFHLLELLMTHPNQVLPHDTMYERVWGYDFGATSNALRVYIGYLRRKLESAGARELIHNVRGVGYTLREP